MTLSTVQPEDGVRLSAVLNDPDGRATSVRVAMVPVYSWERIGSPETDAPDISNLSELYSQEPSGDWARLIAGETSAHLSRLFRDRRGQRFLLVTATYSDRKTNVTVDDSSGGIDQTKDQARVASDNEVQGPDTNNKPPKFPDQRSRQSWRPKGPNKRSEGGRGLRRRAARTTPGDVGDPVTAVDCDGGTACADSTDDTEQHGQADLLAWGARTPRPSPSSGARARYRWLQG